MFAENYRQNEQTNAKYGLDRNRKPYQPYEDKRVRKKEIHCFVHTDSSALMREINKNNIEHTHIQLDGAFFPFIWVDIKHQTEAEEKKKIIIAITISIN